MSGNYTKTVRIVKVKNLIFTKKFKSKFPGIIIPLLPNLKKMGTPPGVKGTLNPEISPVSS